MSREIKFRAWDGIRITTSGIMFNTSTGNLDVPTEASFGGKITNPYKLMQYIGIKDKSGKEIYEGDILSIYQISGGSKMLEMVGKVVYYKDRFEFETELKKDDIVAVSICDMISKGRTVEVIGNIYEPNK